MTANEIANLTGMELDRAVVRVKWPDAHAERMLSGTPILIWNDIRNSQCIGRHGMGDELQAWADTARKVIEKEYRIIETESCGWAYGLHGSYVMAGKDTPDLALKAAKRDYLTQHASKGEEDGLVSMGDDPIGHDCSCALHNGNAVEEIATLKSALAEKDALLQELRDAVRDFADLCDAVDVDYRTGSFKVEAEALLNKAISHLSASEKKEPVK